MLFRVDVISMKRMLSSLGLVYKYLSRSIKRIILSLAQRCWRHRRHRVASSSAARAARRCWLLVNDAAATHRYSGGSPIRHFGVRRIYSYSRYHDIREWHSFNLPSSRAEAPSQRNEGARAFAALARAISAKRDH